MLIVRQKIRPAVVAVLSVFAFSIGLAALQAGTAPADDEAKSRKSPVEGYRLQELDEPLELAAPRTDEEQGRVDAIAWFMTGQLREERNDFAGALEAYRKSIELYPHSTEVYRALVPLAFALNQNRDAINYALKAVELDPEDFQLLRQLGVHLAGEGRLKEAVELLEQAGRSPRLEKKSAVSVMLNRELAIVYGATEQIEKAADAYEVLFDALVNPNSYQLDFRTRAALAADPVTSFEQIGQVFLEADRPEQAVRAFERAAEDRKGKPGSLNFNLARVYFQTEQFDNALGELQKYFDAQLQSQGRAAYQLLADILQKTGKSDELIERVELLAEKDPHNSTLQFFLAEQYLAADRLKEAEELYHKSLESAGDAEAYRGLATIYRRQDRPEELLDALSKSLSHGGGGDPEQIERNLSGLGAEMEAIGEDEELLDRLLAVGRKLSEGDEPELDFPGSLILAKLAANAEKFEAAIDFYRWALNTAGNRALLVYEEFGEHLLSVNNYSEAVKLFEEAVNAPALAAAKPNFLFRLSQAHAFNDDIDAALEAVREAREMVPEHPLLHYQEAWVRYQARHWDEAVRLFEQVIARYPQNQEIVRRCRFILSNVHVQRGDMREGEKILEEIYEQDPDDPSVNNDLGYLYADQGKNLEQAEQMIRKAVEAEPENSAYLDSMGWVLYKLGRYDEALPYLEKATEQASGSDGVIYDHLGDCYDRLDKPEQAVEAWRKALEQAQDASHPDEELIEQIQKKLKEHENQ